MTYFGISAPRRRFLSAALADKGSHGPRICVGHITWESPDPSVLRVLSNGKVVAVGQVKRVITASVGECTSSVTITVTGNSPVSPA